MQDIATVTELFDSLVLCSYPGCLLVPFTVLVFRVVDSCGGVVLGARTTQQGVDSLVSGVGACLSLFVLLIGIQVLHQNLKLWRGRERRREVRTGQGLCYYALNRLEIFNTPKCFKVSL